MEKANNGDKLATSLATMGLFVKTYARCPRRNKKIVNSIKPMPNDTRFVTTIEYLAAFELPRPSSFETLTLYILTKKKNYIK